MTQRTCNIIMVCKDACKYANNQALNLVDRIKVYMGKECWYDWNNYSESQIEGILFTALQEYIDEVKRPSYVLWELRDISRRHNTLSECICVLFQIAQVRDNNTYINGFTEELLNQSKIELDNIEFAS